MACQLHWLSVTLFQVFTLTAGVSGEGLEQAEPAPGGAGSQIVPPHPVHSALSMLSTPNIVLQEGQSPSEPRAAMDKWLAKYLSTRGTARSRPQYTAVPPTQHPQWQDHHQQQQEQGEYVDMMTMRRLEMQNKFPRRGVDAPPPPPPLQTPACVLEEESRGRRRENLILAAVGDAFNAAVWLSHPDYANFDLVVIHYGRDANFSCSLCKKVFRSSGPKWRLVYEVFAAGEWGEVAGGYGAVMVADDDLEMDTCTVNSAFDVFNQYRLLLAQPSLCNSQKVYTYYKMLFQKPAFRLRYTTFVEIMAPIFNMDMFNGMVGPSLYNAYTGWGLDFVWPFLLKYPRDRIGVIDEVCINNPHGSMKAGPGLYASLLPYSQQEEQRRREAEYRYFDSELRALGYTMHPVLELGGVLRPPPLPPPPPTAMQRVDHWLSSVWGKLYPVAALGQTGVILMVVCVLASKRLLLRRSANNLRHSPRSLSPAGLHAL